MKAMAARPGERFLHHAIVLQLPRRDCLVNSGEILINDSAGAEIQMTDFGIAHLSFGQADIRAAGAQRSARIIAIQLVVKWRPRKKRRVPIFKSLRFLPRINAPTVANDKHHGARHTTHSADDESNRQAVSPWLRD